MTSIIRGNLPELAVVFNDSSNAIPFDISFEIVEDVGVKKSDCNKIKGHKVFLAAFSPVKPRQTSLNQPVTDQTNLFSYFPTKYSRIQIVIKAPMPQ